MHAEWGEVSADTAAALNAARAAGGRIVAVGTTSLRLLETAATHDDGTIRPFAGETALFITPGYRFKAVDLLMTNFHLPRSTLFMLVAAFSGLDDHARRLRPRHRGRLSLLFLWRCLPAPPGDAAAMSERFAFTLMKTDGGARLGEIATPRGMIRTPAFMPVGTAATVKAVTTDQLEAAGVDVVLANTYHLMLRPGRRAHRQARRPARASCAGTARSSRTPAASRS